MILYSKHTLQNPNELDSKVTLEFDHVKKGLKVDDEGNNLVTIVQLVVGFCFDIYDHYSFSFKCQN